MTQISQTVAELRETFEAGKTRPFDWRRGQLLRLKAMIRENETAIFDALKADLGRASAETRMVETGTVLAEIGHILSHLKTWMRPKKVTTPLNNQPGRSWVVSEPLGVVLIMAPWNYPFITAVNTIVPALMAGSAVVLKHAAQTLLVVFQHAGELAL